MRRILKDPRPSAGVIIVGNEILSGKVEERNAAFFVKRFRALGVRLAEIGFIEDGIDCIASTVRRMSAAWDIVCTSGGVGPTHDDVTIEGIARAFGVGVVESPELRGAMEALLGAGRVKPGHLRMARVPEGSDILLGESVPWPSIRCRNVYVFPGVPWLLKTKFADLEATHFVGARPPHVRELQLQAEEADVCEALDALVQRHAAVQVGSYPRYEAGQWRLRLTFEGQDEAAVSLALSDADETFDAFRLPSG